MGWMQVFVLRSLCVKSIKRERKMQFLFFFLSFLKSRIGSRVAAGNYLSTLFEI